MEQDLSITGKLLTILIASFFVCIMIFTLVSVDAFGTDTGLFHYSS